MRNTVRGVAWILIWAVAGAGCKASSPQKALEEHYKPPEFPVIDSRMRSPMDFKRVGELPELQEGGAEIFQKEPQHKVTALRGKTDADDKFKKAPYLSDKEYLKINRHERLFLQTPGENGNGLSVYVAPEPRDTIRVRDKPLVLAGRGFEIDDFSVQSEERLHFQFTRRLEKTLPEKPPQKPDTELALDFEHTMSTKDLIFHPSGPAFSKMPAPEAEASAEDTTVKEEAYVRRIPETRVLLEKGQDTQIFLEPGEQSLDVLIGNETLNNEIYKNWKR